MPSKSPHLMTKGQKLPKAPYPRTNHDMEEKPPHTKKKDHWSSKSSSLISKEQKPPKAPHPRMNVLVLKKPPHARVVF